jgi:excisionase family DNA binding protein
VDEQALPPAVVRVARALVASGFDPGVTEDVQADGERPPYTVPEAARLLKVHESTLYRAIQSGDLPALSVGRAGRAIRIPADDFDAFKAKRMIRRVGHRTRRAVTPITAARGAVA